MVRDLIAQFEAALDRGDLLNTFEAAVEEVDA